MSRGIPLKNYFKKWVRLYAVWNIGIKETMSCSCAVQLFLHAMSTFVNPYIMIIQIHSTLGYSEKIKMKKSCWDSFFLLYYIIINYFYFGHFLIWTCFASQNWTSIFRQLGWFPLGGAKLPMISKHDNFRIFYRRTKSEPALKCSRKELFKTV